MMQFNDEEFLALGSHRKCLVEFYRGRKIHIECLRVLQTLGYINIEGELMQSVVEYLRLNVKLFFDNKCDW